jgi:thioredoxin-related protein
VISSINAQEPPAWFSESLLELRDDVAEAAKQGKRVMLYFGQDGCPYCKQLMEVNFRQASIAAKAQKNLVALAINIWGDREVIWTDGENHLGKAPGRQAQGAIHADAALLDEQGGVALRMNGYYPPHEFDAALDYVAGRHGEESGVRRVPEVEAEGRRARGAQPAELLPAAAV